MHRIVIFETTTGNPRFRVENELGEIICDAEGFGYCSRNKRKELGYTARQMMATVWSLWVAAGSAPCAPYFDTLIKGGGPPLPATAADMLRLAACMATDASLRIAAPVHDAFLLSSSEESIEEDVRKLREIMAEASNLVLNGVITCRTSVEGGIIRWPDRYVDDGGEEMWGKVMGRAAIRTKPVDRQG